MKIELIKTQRALAPTGMDLADYVINPYIGCEFGCVYCYTRSNKNVSRVARPWGNFVFVKQNLPEILEKELRNKPARIKKVLIGSTTDPLQPAEKNYRITKSILTILKKYNISAVILTRSSLIEDYLDLLKYSSDNTVYFTYNSLTMKKIFSSPVFQKESLNVIETIYKSKLNLVVYISPVFPGLINTEEIFRKLEGKTGKIYFENYNMKLGNWKEIKKILTQTFIKKHEKIYFDADEYTNFWNNFIKTTDILNKSYKYRIKYFIYPFNSFYPVRKPRPSPR